MALSKEDKADVKGAMGKALANKVSRATKDRFAKNPFAKKYKEKMDDKEHARKADKAVPAFMRRDKKG